MTALIGNYKKTGTSKFCETIRPSKGVPNLTQYNYLQKIIQESKQWHSHFNQNSGIMSLT